MIVVISLQLPAALWLGPLVDHLVDALPKRVHQSQELRCFFRFSLGQFQVTVVSDGTLLFQRRRSGQKRVKRNATPSLFRTSSLRTNLLSK